MYHRMYLRRSSMSSISEESEISENNQLHVDFVEDNKQTHETENELAINLHAENCLGDLNSFKEVSIFCHSFAFPVDRSFLFK